MFGFIQADGHLHQNTRNRGRLEIELQESDRNVLEQFAKIIPFNSNISTRTRNTNFKDNYTSVTFSVCDKRFRDQLVTAGLTYGKKSNCISIPDCNMATNDYWRGVIDGDGSLGLTGKGFPFLSLNCSSEQMINAYIQFLNSITGKIKTTSRNSRDNTYNVCINKEDVQAVVQQIYSNSTIALQRKKVLANVIAGWRRPATMNKIDFPRKPWTQEEDRFILNNSTELAVSALNRTSKSVQTRLWRLTKCQ